MWCAALSFFTSTSVCSSVDTSVGDSRDRCILVIQYRYQNWLWVKRRSMTIFGADPSWSDSPPTPKYANIFTPRFRLTFCPCMCFMRVVVVAASPNHHKLQKQPRVIFLSKQQRRLFWAEGVAEDVSSHSQCFPQASLSRLSDERRWKYRRLEAVRAAPLVEATDKR